jgi:hypothetical protein
MITITLAQEEADFLRRMLEREAETAPPAEARDAQRLRGYLPAGPPAISTVFDALHRRFDFFATLPEMQQQIVERLQQHGLDERTALQMASGYLLGGESFGHAHAIDAANLIEKAFYQQNVRELSLRVAADGDVDTYIPNL